MNDDWIERLAPAIAGEWMHRPVLVATLDVVRAAKDCDGNDHDAYTRRNLRAALDELREAVEG